MCSEDKEDKEDLIDPRPLVEEGQRIMDELGIGPTTYPDWKNDEND